VFFRAATVKEAVTYLGAMFGIGENATSALEDSQRVFVIVVVMGCFAVEGLQEWLERRSTAVSGVAVAIAQRPVWALIMRPVAYATLLAVTVVAAPSAGPRFIYFQF
jgi:hypothetical protein